MKFLSILILSFVAFSTIKAQKIEEKSNNTNQKVTFTGIVTDAKTSTGLSGSLQFQR